MAINIEEILAEYNSPALLAGNGRNRHRDDTDNSSWERLLQEIAKRQGIALTSDQLAEMSNTEFFDILDLARPREDRSNPQREFCHLMSAWRPEDHHRLIMGWAARHSVPVGHLR